MAKQQQAYDPLVDSVPARFLVGIDLGTTNSAVAYVDTLENERVIRDFPIPQIVAPGVVEWRDVLPSFHYQATDTEVSTGAVQLPWHKTPASHVVGIWARDEGGKSMGRLISSAKSWLCHSGVDRTADLLPWHPASDVERISPVEASSRYLQHIREAWNSKFPQDPLSRQEIVLTLPASFDEVARELTIEAASRAGLPRVVLIEEPQAAFYAWVYKHKADWHTRVEPGQTILICDIGGGTTDFTLLRVRRGPAADGKSGCVEFHRVAVGDHLILGGDNLDLALAHHVETSVAGTQPLSPRQWDALVRTCRKAKESMLSRDAPKSYTINLPPSGTKLIGGSLQFELTGNEICRVLVDGFLPFVPGNAVPLKRQSGFQEFGLPYAPDPAITRYLANFLTVHQSAGLEIHDERESSSGQPSSRPHAILFNGGFFASPVLRERLLEVMANWYAADPGPKWSPHLLENDRIDLAVARGAAYFGMVRRGEGVRINANLARSYYIGIEAPEPSAVCLIPGAATPGEQIQLSDRKFSVLISEPVEFPLYVSSTRLVDRPGDLVTVNPEQLRSLPPIRTVLRAQSRKESGAVSVELNARLSEIGTIEMWCSDHNRDRSWRLQFDVRSATQTDLQAQSTTGEAAGLIDEQTWRMCEAAIASVFGPEGKQPPEKLIKNLIALLQCDRTDWPPALLRRIWEALMNWEAGRRRSPAHETRWLNLLGFALRPGFGMAVDDWRVSETWRSVRGRLAHTASACRNESMILWRRIAGGLSAGQQRALAEPLLPAQRDLFRRSIGPKHNARRREAPRGANESTEVWCLLGSLELLPLAIKIELGEMVSQLLEKGSTELNRGALSWTLGRIGQRVPTYGPLNCVVPIDSVSEWIVRLLRQEGRDGALHLAMMQLARRTSDRYRDLDGSLREEVVEWLERYSASPHLVELVKTGGQLDHDEQVRVFGESLPKGLRLVN